MMLASYSSSAGGDRLGIQSEQLPQLSSSVEHSLTERPRRITARVAQRCSMGLDGEHGFTILRGYFDQVAKEEFPRSGTSRSAGA